MEGEANLELRQRLVKISFALDSREWHGSGGESLWYVHLPDR
jgi:hypothetical protein